MSLTERAKKISAFTVPNGLYHYKVMPFGMKNSRGNFQRLMNSVIASCEAYIDDIICFSDDWEKHLEIISISILFESCRSVFEVLISSTTQP